MFLGLKNGLPGCGCDMCQFRYLTTIEGLSATEANAIITGDGLPYDDMEISAFGEPLPDGWTDDSEYDYGEPVG